jgi:hypothetical protein
MSKVVIQGNASGTGNFTIAAPNSDTNRTLTLPDEAGEVLVNGTTSNVGIGTTSPSGMLHLSGALPRIYFTDTDTSAVSSFSGENGWLTLNAETSRITFNIAGSEHMRIDSSGRVTTPNQPSFRANKTVDQTSGFPGVVTVTWDSMAYDVGSNFNLGTSKFVAPVTGKYAFSTGLRVDAIDTAAAFYIIKIATSNANYQWIIDPNYVSDLSYTTFTLSTIADMDASDTAFVQIQQSAGHATTHIHGSTGYDWFSGHLLG